MDTEQLRREAEAYYPSVKQVDAWAEKLFEQTAQVAVAGTLLDPIMPEVFFGIGPNTLVNRYVRFTADDGRRPFYGYWQPAIKTPAPLLINLPGYGSSILLHPQLADMGFNILHISPLGYVGPGHVETGLALDDGRWPVLDHTARGLAGGYEDWLSDCLLAVRWAIDQPGVLPRVSLYGTSQGGGGSLLLASLLGDQVSCVCADLPFLTDFPGSSLDGPAYDILRPAYETEPHRDFWKRLGFVDTISHAHRLHIPVMLSAGGLDNTCPSATVERLFAVLHCTKQYTYCERVSHTHSRESMALFGAWLHLFA